MEVLPMNRLEMYKQKRRQKRVVFLSLFLGITIIVVGLMTVDAAINEMLGLEETKIMHITQKADAVYEVKLMNHYVTVNLIYAKQDYNRFVHQGKQLWGNFVVRAKKVSEEVRAAMKE